MLLAGFVLAHAAWSISDAPELLVPLAVVEKHGQREVMRFEADTQEEAIAHGRAQMAALGPDADSWAFAREGVVRQEGGNIDVIGVDIGFRGSTQHITLVQRFEPYARRHQFRLLGEPQVVVDGKLSDPEQAKAILEGVRRGISQHTKVAPLWDGWHKP